jgi:hypothetical protein
MGEIMRNPFLKQLSLNPVVLHYLIEQDDVIVPGGQCHIHLMAEVDDIESIMKKYDYVRSDNITPIFRTKK